MRVESIALEHRMAIAKAIDPAGNDHPCGARATIPSTCRSAWSGSSLCSNLSMVSSNYVVHDPLGYLGFDGGVAPNLESPMRPAAADRAPRVVDGQIAAPACAGLDVTLQHRARAGGCRAFGRPAQARWAAD